jgi:hypothetical protein
MDEIVAIINGYGWFVALFIFILFMLIKMIVSSYGKWSSKNDTDLPDELLSNEEILRIHPFFSNAEYRYSVEIPNLDLVPEKPTRERVFKDLLRIAFKVVVENARAFVERKDLVELTAEEFVHAANQIINKIITDTEDKARREEIPEVVIRKFLKWHAESIESLHEYVLLLGNSKLYNTNISKLNTLLLIMDLLLVTILGDAERVLRTINGELTGLIYKGSKVE